MGIIGEKSSPPIGGMRFLNGLNTKSQIILIVLSGSLYHAAFGKTQLATIPMINIRKNISKTASTNGAI